MSRTGALSFRCCWDLERPVGVLRAARQISRVATELGTADKSSGNGRRLVIREGRQAAPDSIGFVEMRHGTCFGHNRK